MFRLITTFTVAKEAWDILKTAHEGTSRVRMSRLQMLTTQFETLRMTEDQTIDEFHMQIRDIANTSFALGEKMTDEKLVRNILRSLPKRFAMKVTAIEEAQDIDKMQVDELIGSWQNFELTLNERSDKKSKSIAFVSNTEEVDDESEVDLAGEFTEALDLLGRNFNKAFKKFDRRPRPNVNDKLSDNFKKFENPRNASFQRRGKDDERPNKFKGIQCHECEGYGHIKSECPTFLKKQKKGMVVTWSDDDSDDDSEDVTANVVMALTAKNCVGAGSSDEEMSEEKLAETYKLMYTKWKELCVICDKQKKIINTLTQENVHLKNMSTCQEHEEMIQSLLEEKKKLQLENTELQEEVSLLESKLEGLNKFLRLLNNGTDALDNLLEASKKGRSKKGNDFDYNPINEEGQKPKSKVVTPEEKSEFVQINDFQKNIKMSQHVVQHVSPSVRSSKQSTWVCHYCGRFGHLRPYCYRLYGYPKVTSKAH